MDIQEAYEKARGEINKRAKEIIEEYAEKGGGMMSVATATSMAEDQYVFGTLYAITNRKKITKKAEKNGEAEETKN